MSAGHTPGPWLHRGKSDSVHQASKTHPYGATIFRFDEEEGPSDEDLSLILSAPDLLAERDRLKALNAELAVALEEVRSDLWLQIEPKHGTKAATNYPSIVKARAALANYKKETA